MHDCASHDIDVIRWVVREEPTEVYASASTFIPRIKEIGLFILLTYLKAYYSMISNWFNT